MITREQLHALVDGLPEQEVAMAHRFLLFLAQEPIGEQFSRSIRRGVEQANAGDTVVCGNYSEMVKKVLGD
ncbi:MAG: hypothetical protein U0Q16_15795 [Bryobacteraceae bacterium]